MQVGPRRNAPLKLGLPFSHLLRGGWILPKIRFRDLLVQLRFLCKEGNNANALAQLRAPIYEDKVVDFLLELANVTEKKVTREELFKEEEDEKTAA